MHNQIAVYVSTKILNEIKFFSLVTQNSTYVTELRKVKCFVTVFSFEKFYFICQN